MPAKVRDIELKPEDINVVAFVTKDMSTEVENVTGGKPEYINFDITPSAIIYQPEIPIGARYGFKFFELYVKNNSVENVTKATFEIATNDDKHNVVVECDIKPFEKKFIKVPCSYVFDKKGILRYEIRLIGLNDNNIEPAVLKGRFTAPLITDNFVKAVIVTDECASQNSFVLKDEDGNVINTFGPYEDGVSNTYEEEIILEEAKTYCFEITDKNADGMMAGVKGSLTTRTGSGKLIDQFYRITNHGIRSFFTLDCALRIDGTEVNESKTGASYSINGIMIDGDDTKEHLIIKNGQKIINK